jgi:signal transduction histidine kinase
MAPAIGHNPFESVMLRLQRLEVLCRLSDVVAGTADLATALRGLNRALHPDLGIQIRSIFISNRQIRETVNAQAPEEEQMEAIRSWRATLAKRRTPLRPRKTSGGLLVPVVHRSRVSGALLVTLDHAKTDPSEEEMLLAIGSGCAEIIYKAGLRRNLAERQHRLAIAAERERIARDLHDSVGQLLTGIGIRLAEHIPEAPDRLWRERLEEVMRLAEKGSREVRQAIHSLLFLQVRKRGLVRSLQEVARKFEAATGIRVQLQTRGPAVILSPAKDDALFRVAHEALMNAERHSRACFVSMVLTYEPGEVSLEIRDDGVGLAHRDPFGSEDGHFGLRGLQLLMDEAGGELVISDAVPRGLIVKGRFCFKRRAA